MSLWNSKRLNRRNFTKFFLGITIPWINIVLTSVFCQKLAIGQPIMLWGAAVIATALYSSCATFLIFKRLADLEQSELVFLLLFVPGINLYWFLTLFLKKGSPTSGCRDLLISRQVSPASRVMVGANICFLIFLSWLVYQDGINTQKLERSQQLLRFHQSEKTTMKTD